MSEDERSITRSLDRARILVAVAAVCVAGVIMGVLLVIQPDSDDQRNPASGSPASSPPPRMRLALQAADSWPVDRPASCAAWKPAERDSVVILDRLDDDCVGKASRAASTVFMAPYRSSTLFGTPWPDSTGPWCEADGHRIQRLDSGPLMEMSFRVVDAAVCQDCDQAIVVLGPDPHHVRALIESISAA